ncbi:DUF6325 family protein [Agromyces atrinae]|uniref:DUF1269 domain-containing protein n=1 Tax=Agromyces atrinae TaxID=592376 RepID=A0A4Q2MCR9_9MICO|nr:DUF6325 family protein [Agromyces atrinae]MCI2956619.1 DUF6325 family protein [Agromyces atrinae]NYD68002.1 hypothetical protein [Agromyces atrinae]RXZ87842.1 hypothetical protein ESP50_01155 [Agromyces atrinae]
MADFEYGPVEIYVIATEGERPDDATFAELARLIDGDLVRLLDLVIVSKSAEGDVTVVEIEDLGDEVDIEVLELEAGGLVGEEDIDEVAPLIEPGSSAAIVALELVWAKQLASTLAASGAVVLSTERIPAPIVNAVLAEASDAEQED